MDNLKIDKYLRKTALPHIWCPGCGNGILLAAICRAIDKMNIEQQKTVIVSGIGCSSRAAGYMNFNTVHTAHGRALSFATGIKLSKPELNVIVITGDGDATAIGGNHFIHAARRNIDITTIVFNNNIYGMTGGQSSPTTMVGSKSTTAPFGHIERSFDISALAITAGATFVARSTAFHTQLVTEMVVKGMQNKGFSVIEAVTQCPVYYGRKNGFKSASKMLEWQRDNAINITALEKVAPEKRTGKFIIGVLHSSPAPEYAEEYHKMSRNLMNGGA